MQGEGTAQGNNNILRFIAMVDAVSQTTLLNFNEVYDISAIEFLQYVSYYNWKEEKKQRAIKKFKKGKK